MLNPSLSVSASQHTVYEVIIDIHRTQNIDIHNSYRSEADFGTPQKNSAAAHSAFI